MNTTEFKSARKYPRFELKIHFVIETEKKEKFLLWISEHYLNFLRTDASSSNEAVHLQQRLQSLSSELLTLKNRLQVQGENTAPSINNPPNPTLHASHIVNGNNATTNGNINACYNRNFNSSSAIQKHRIPIPPLTSNIPLTNSKLQSFIKYSFVTA